MNVCLFPSCFTSLVDSVARSPSAKILNVGLHACDVPMVVVALAWPRQGRG